MTLRHHEKKQIRLDSVGRAFHHQSRLAEIVQNQRGKNNQPPTGYNRLPAEVPEVSVEGLRARHRQHDRSHHRPRPPASCGQEPQPVKRIQSLQDLRTRRDLHKTQRRQYQKPHQHHRPKNPAQPTRAETLDREKHTQNPYRQWNRIITPRRVHACQPLHRTQNRNRWGYRSVSKEQRRTNHQQTSQPSTAQNTTRMPSKNPRHQCKNPALAVIIHPHDQQHIFYPHHQKKSPNDQRRHPQSGLGSRETHRDLIRIQRTRADIPKHNAQRQNRHSGSARFVLHLGHRTSYWDKSSAVTLCWGREASILACSTTRSGDSSKR